MSPAFRPAGDTAGRSRLCPAVYQYTAGHTPPVPALFAAGEYVQALLSGGIPCPFFIRYDDEMETERIFLRTWAESDAEACYLQAKDPRIGPIAGWPPHSSIEESRNVIRDVFSAPNTYAIILKATGLPIGCIGLKQGSHTDLTDKPDECELGYWLGVPYWGQGIMTEAARLILHHAFVDLGMNIVWCSYYDGNERSMRVQEKCGFRYRASIDNVDAPLLHDKRKVHISCLRREEWRDD